MKHPANQRHRRRHHQNLHQNLHQNQSRNISALVLSHRSLARELKDRQKQHTVWRTTKRRPLNPSWSSFAVSLGQYSGKHSFQYSRKREPFGSLTRWTRGWWVEMDSNQRKLTLADLQSVVVAADGNRGLFHLPTITHDIPRRSICPNIFQRRLHQHERVEGSPTGGAC